jgi:hypothetical protein
LATIATAGTKAGCTLERVCSVCSCSTKVGAVPDSAFEFVKVSDDRTD